MILNRGCFVVSGFFVHFCEQVIEFRRFALRDHLLKLGGRVRHVS